MMLKILAPLAALSGLTLAAASAQAQSWGEKIEMCAAAAEEEGLVDLAEYEPEFDGGNSRRVSLVFTPVRTEDVIEVECRISRGRVVSVEPAS